MLLVIRDSRPQTQRIYVTIWVFTYYMKSLPKKSINKIQATLNGQGTCQLFNLQFIWAKCKPLTQELKGILCLTKPPSQTYT